MATPVGRTLYKKKDGILTINPEHTTVTWTPNSGGPATVSLPVANITSPFTQSPFPSLRVLTTSRSSANTRYRCQGYAQGIRKGFRLSRIHHVSLPLQHTRGKARGKGCQRPTLPSPHRSSQYRSICTSGLKYWHEPIHANSWHTCPKWHSKQW